MSIRVCPQSANLLSYAGLGLSLMFFVTTMLS